MRRNGAACAPSGLLRALALSFPFLLLLACAPAAKAQEPEAPPGAQQQDEAERRPRSGRGAGGNLFRRLGLTPEQVRQLSEIRRQSEPETRALTRRLNQARRALDEAIYADALDETAVEARVREVSAAQSALVRLRAITEARVRRILTPEQLQTFRELRQQARQRQRRRREGRRGNRPGAERRTPRDFPTNRVPS